MRRHVLLAFGLCALALGCGPDDTSLSDGTFDAGGAFEGGKLQGHARHRPARDAGPGREGFIGSPCEEASECAYDDAVCVAGGGFVEGTCTLPCNLYCPDREGFPTTFCVADDGLPPEAQGLGDGACFSRCDFGAHPEGGCREGYACVERRRANEPSSSQLVCLPEGEDPGLPDCYGELAAMGVSFSPVTMADESPAGAPELTCHVEDPVLLHPPVHGVDLVYYDGTPTPNVRMSCEGAKALVRTVLDVAPAGVHTIRHIGTYNCRVIAGTSSLSAHSYGDAIDFYSFELDGDRHFTLLDDWEHDTDAPESEGGQFLYEASWRWYDDNVWNIILTPNYNAAHANHFHVDLTPGSHFRGLFEGRYWGPSPHGD